MGGYVREERGRGWEGGWVCEGGEGERMGGWLVGKEKDICIIHSTIAVQLTKTDDRYVLRSSSHLKMNNKPDKLLAGQTTQQSLDSNVSHLLHVPLSNIK